MNRSIVPLLAISTLVTGGCASSSPPEGIYYASGKGSVSVDGLHRVDWEPFKITYVRPGADLNRYDKVLIDAVSVSYKTPPTPEAQQGVALHPTYALPDSALQSMKQYFHSEFSRSLSKSKNFSVSESPGPDVLRLSGHIMNLEITAPPAADQAPDETDWSSSPGKMTLVLDARDSQSGETLVRVGQAQTVQLGDGSWYQVDPVGNSAAIQEIFRSWADTLTRELDQFHALPQLPPVSHTAPAR